MVSWIDHIEIYDQTTASQLNFALESQKKEKSVSYAHQFKSKYIFLFAIELAMKKI